MFAAIREQPVDIIDAEHGLIKLCTVKAGPKCEIKKVKHEIEENAGVPTREVVLTDANGYKYKDFDHIGIDIFKTAMEAMPAETPKLLFRRLTHEEANVAEGRHTAIEAIKHGTHMQHIDDEFKNDPEVCLFAVEHTNPSELQYASDAVKEDIDTMLQALRLSSTCMYYVSEKLWDDRTFVKGAMTVDGLLLGASMVPQKWRDDVEVVMYACESHGYALKHASKEIKDNRSVVLAAVNQRGTALMYASKTLREDYYVVIDAVRQNKMAIVHAMGDLREDTDIRAAAGQGPSDKMMDHEKLDRIKAKFHELDENGDGFLSYNELEALLRKGNPDMNEDEIRLLYNQMDTHRDERVDFHEFCDYIFGDD